MIPGDSAAEAVITSGLYNFLYALSPLPSLLHPGHRLRLTGTRLSDRNIYNNIILVRLVLTWFPNPPQQIVGPLRWVARSPRCSLSPLCRLRGVDDS